MVLFFCYQNVVLTGLYSPVLIYSTKVETLGYHKLSDKEKKFLNLLFDRINVITLDDEIITSAIHLKQHRKTSLGDALIAATALTKKLTLVTNNTDDFENIKGLKLIDPLK